MVRRLIVLALSGCPAQVGHSGVGAEHHWLFAATCSLLGLAIAGSWAR